MKNPEEILKNLLLQIADELNYDKYDLKIVPISSGGANYTSILFNVTITVGANEIHMFAKVAAIGEKMRTQKPKIYTTENFVYTKLAKVYDRLQDECQVSQEHRLTFPKFYGGKLKEYEETIVLEDLAKGGYQAYDRFATFDWEYAKSSLRQLAKLHALSLAYDEAHPEEFKEIAENLKIEWDMTNPQNKAYYDCMVQRSLTLVSEDVRDKLQNYFDTIAKDAFPDYYKSIRRPVLGHGDFRPSNLMHKVLDDGSIDIKIVDLQTLQGGSPVIDLLYFLITGSDEAFRAQYYEKYLDHYYTELAAAMKRLHLEPEKVYSREDFDFELNKKLPFGLTIAVFSLPIITVEVENAPKVGADMDLSSFSVDKPSNLYSERLNGVINDYIKWGVLK